MTAKFTIVAIAVAALTGCAATAEPTDPEKIRVHESVTSAPQVAEVLKRLWIESKATAFVFPSYGSADEAAADLRQQASRLGGNGVVNFGCYRMGDAADAPLKCNGTVVRFK